MERHLFGTDGIRGKANAGYMTAETAFRVGAAMTYYVKRSGKKSAPYVVIGKDTRISGYLFETALAAGVCSMGGRVLLSGPLPTPAIAHLTQSMRADAGIVVSASHNPYEDNGIKIFGRDGFKLPDAVEHELEHLMQSDVLDQDRPTDMDVGRALRLDDAKGRYVAFVKSTFPNDLSLDGLRIVVDAAHGAAYRAAPTIFTELGATVFALGVNPDGKNINDGCGATHPEFCANEVLRQRADLGIALDGDADRIIVIDDRGQEVDGDAIMALCAQQMIKDQKLRKNTLVATVMSNLGLERALQRMGGSLVRCAVGDRYVVETMRSNELNFGGEASGHMIFLDHSTTGDGMVAGLQLLAVAVREQKPVSELAHKAIERVPQLLVNVKCPTKRPLEAMPATSRCISEIEKSLGHNGRVLVRWSGTEAKLRIMVEGDDQAQIQNYASEIAEEAQRELNA